MLPMLYLNVFNSEPIFQYINMKNVRVYNCKTEGTTTVASFVIWGGGDSGICPHVVFSSLKYLANVAILFFIFYGGGLNFFFLIFYVQIFQL